MIVANLATYPARQGHILDVVQAIAPQVDRLNVVLNEYDGLIESLSAFDNVSQIIPPEDTKDVGKFYPDITGAKYVFLIDDDLVYPADYVTKTVERFEAIGTERKAAGYHCSVYVRPTFSMSPKKLKKWLLFGDRRIANYRTIEGFKRATQQSRYVDQTGTGVSILRGKDMPPFEYMKTSQRFVDVRLAKWLFESEIPVISLPKEQDWIGERNFDETIFRSFTKQNFDHVANEILTYAFKRPKIGTLVPPRQ